MGVLWKRTLMGGLGQVFNIVVILSIRQIVQVILFSLVLYSPFLLFVGFGTPVIPDRFSIDLLVFSCQKLEGCLSSLGVGVVTQFQIMRFSCFSAQVQGAHRGSEGASNAVMSALFLLEEVINLISLDRNNEVIYTFV